WGVQDVELEGLEDLAGAQPHVLAGAHIQGRAQRVCVAPAHRRVEPVGGEHQVVGGGQLFDVGGVGLEVHGDVELAAAGLHDLQQSLAGHRGETVTAGGQDLVADVDVDVIPAGELPLH